MSSIKPYISSLALWPCNRSHRNAKINTALWITFFAVAILFSCIAYKNNWPLSMRCVRVIPLALLGVGVIVSFIWSLTWRDLKLPAEFLEEGKKIFNPLPASYCDDSSAPRKILEIGYQLYQLIKENDVEAFEKILSHYSALNMSTLLDNKIIKVDDDDTSTDCSFIGRGHISLYHFIINLKQSNPHKERYIKAIFERAPSNLSYSQGWIHITQNKELIYLMLSKASHKALSDLILNSVLQDAPNLSATCQIWFDSFLELWRISPSMKKAISPTILKNKILASSFSTKEILLQAIEQNEH